MRIVVIRTEQRIVDARKAFQKAKKTSHNEKPGCYCERWIAYHKAINKEFWHNKGVRLFIIPNVGVKVNIKKL